VAIFRKTVLATALIGSGLVSTTGLAMAHESHDGGQRGAVNVDDIQTIVPVNACNNNVPVNVLGVQVPIQDVAGNVPILSPVEHGENAAGNAKSCSNGVKAHN
jgi:hypothetical protein